MRRAWQLVLALLAAQAGVLGCQKFGALEPPERPSTGSALLLGVDDDGSNFVLADDGVSSFEYPAIKTRAGLSLYDLRLACTLEELGGLAPGLQTLEPKVERKPNAPPPRPLLPKPVSLQSAQIHANGELTSWSDRAELEPDAAALIERLPLEPDNACRLATSVLEGTSIILNDVGVPNDLLVPLFGIELATDDYLLAHEHAEDVAGGSTSALTLHRVRNNLVTTIATGKDLGYMGATRMNGEIMIFGRHGLTRVDQNGEEFTFTTLTSSTPSPTLYEAKIVGSPVGEAPELFVLSNAYVLVGNRPPPDQSRTFRHYNGREWDQILRIPAPAMGADDGLSLTRIGPNQAVAVGLGGANELFWLHDGTLERKEQPSNLRVTGDISFVRHVPGLGLIVVSNKAAVFSVELSTNAWTELKPAADDPENVVALNQIQNLLALPEGFVAFGFVDRSERGALIFEYAKGVGSCQPTEWSMRPSRYTFALVDGGLVTLEYNAIADQLRFQVGHVLRRPLACASE